MSYLDICNLEKRYTKNGPLITDHMNMKIEKGEFAVFLGPSGCGKTTTLRMIAGLEDVTGGDILLDGHSIINKTPKERGVSMIFQSYAVWPHMTVFDNIAYPLKLKNIPKADIEKRVKDAAIVTQIQNLLDRYPAQMSGGQRQRVAVSRAIVINPTLFLMDEPLSNLDAKLRVSMRSELRDIHNRMGTTSIFVTHDQAEAMSLADRIFIMNKGRIEQVGTPSEVYQKSATKFVAGFIGTPPTNFFDVEIAKSEEGLKVVSDSCSCVLPQSFLNALASYEGKKVDLGIRPENLQILCPADRREVFAKATINFIEQQGSHAIVIVDMGGNQVKIMKSEYETLKKGQIIELGVNKDKLGFFDKETECRII